MSEHHIISPKVYLTIFTALMVGTALTYWTAFANLGGFGNLIVALLIAVTKATLVILWFMHVRYSSRLIGLVVAGSFFWFLLLVVLTMGDYLGRYYLIFPFRAPYSGSTPW